MESISEEHLLVELKKIFWSKGSKLDIINAIRDRIDYHLFNIDDLSDKLNEVWLIVHGDDSIERTYKKLRSFFRRFS